MNKYQTGEIVALLQKSHSVIVISHLAPDGDTIGAGLALTGALRALGKRAAHVCDDRTPETYRFLDEQRYLQQPDAYAGQQFDVAVAVDCADPARMGRSIAFYEAARARVNIDHHVSNAGYADYNLVDASAASSGELMFAIVDRLLPEFDETVINGLFTAISTDTGNFAYGNTREYTFKVAAELVRRGADVRMLTERVYRLRSLGKTRLIARTINKLRLYLDDRLCISVLTREDFASCGATDDETEGLVDFLREIRPVEIALLLREQDGQFKGSLRSKKYADMVRMAGAFGGGGHTHAAGFTVDQTPEALLPRILEIAAVLLDERG